MQEHETCEDDGVIACIMMSDLANSTGDWLHALSSHATPLIFMFWGGEEGGVIWCGSTLAGVGDGDRKRTRKSLLERSRDVCVTGELASSPSRIHTARAIRLPWQMAKTVVGRTCVPRGFPLRSRFTRTPFCIKPLARTAAACIVWVRKGAVDIEVWGGFSDKALGLLPPFPSFLPSFLSRRISPPTLIHRIINQHHILCLSLLPCHSFLLSFYALPFFISCPFLSSNLRRWIPSSINVLYCLVTVIPW